jgi:N-acetyl-gamma-glutamylphosphate reductase
MSKNDLVVVTGAGGFIGGHLVKVLQQRGHTRIRVVDIKPIGEWYQVFPQADNRVLDLKSLANCRKAPKWPAWRGSTTSPPTWAAWASSRPTRPSACCRC